MSNVLHTLKAILQSDVSGFRRKMEAAAKSTEGLRKSWDALRKSAGQANVSTDKLISRIREGAAIARSVETATERYNRQVRELKRHLKNGAISQETFNRAVARSKRELRDAAGGTEELARKWKNAGAAISTAANRVGLAVTGMATAIAVKFGEFEATMTRAGAVTRTLGTQDFALLEESARKMGETTVFSASQAAGAIEVMGLAGLKTTEIVEALPGALQLAAAGSVDIATAANSAAKLMRAFGADASELGHINDVLVGTFTRANTDLLMLSESMKHVAPVSKSLGVSIEDTAAVIAKMSDAGFQGSIAGTSLRNIMSRLAGAVPAATKQLRALGVETIDLATNKMRPLFEILQDIEKSGMTEAQILQIFGARGGPQLLAVLEAGTASLRQFSAELQNMGGIAEEVAEAQLNTLSGAWMLFKSQVESFLIDAGQDLAPTIRKAADEVQRFLSANKAAIVENMSNAVKSLVTGFRGLVRWATENSDALTALGNTLANVLTIIGNLAAKFPMITAAFVSLKVAGILGLTGAVTSLGKALTSTIKSLIAFRTAATAAGAATAGAGTAATGALPALAAILGPAGIFVVGAAAIWATVEALKAYNKEQERSRREGMKKKTDKQIKEDAAELERGLTTARRGGAFGGAITQELQKAQEKREAALRAANAAAEKAARLQEEATTTKGIGDIITMEEKQAARLADVASRQADKLLIAANRELEQVTQAFFEEAQKAFDRNLAEAFEGMELPKEVLEFFSGEFIVELGKFKEGKASADEFLQGISRLGIQMREEAKKLREEEIASRPERQRQAETEALTATREELRQRELEQRQEAAGPEFGRVSEMLQRENITEPAVRLIAESIEGATPEIVDLLVGQFRTLKEAGELTAENINLAVLVTLEALKKAQEKSELAKTEADRVQSDLTGFQTEVAQSDATDAQKMSAQEGAFQLQEQFSSGQITLEIFRQRLAALRQELQNGIQATQQKIAAQQQADNAVQGQLSRFTAKLGEVSGLSAMAMQKFTEAAQHLQKVFDAGKITMDQFKAKLQTLLGQAKQVAAGGGGGLFGGGGSGGGLMGLMNRPLNKIGGDALSWTQDIAEFFGSNVQDAAQNFRDTVENTDTRSMMQRIYDSLMPSMHPFTSVSGQTPSMEGGGGGGGNVTMNVNVQKLTDAEIRRLHSVSQEEARRRGRSAF